MYTLMQLKFRKHSYSNMVLLHVNCVLEFDMSFGAYFQILAFIQFVTYAVKQAGKLLVAVQPICAFAVKT